MIVKTVVKKTSAKTLAAELAARAKTPTTETASAATMTKPQVIRYMANQMQVAPRQIGAFFDLLFETATMQIQQAGEFKVPHLGKLVKSGHRARIVKNPVTGETIKIAARTGVRFRLSKRAKDAIVTPK